MGEQARERESAYGRSYKRGSRQTPSERESAYERSYKTTFTTQSVDEELHESHSDSYTLYQPSAQTRGEK